MFLEQVKEFLLKLQEAPCDKALKVIVAELGCKPEIAESIAWKKQTTAALLAEVGRLKAVIEAAMEEVGHLNGKTPPCLTLLILPGVKVVARAFLIKLTVQEPDLASEDELDAEDESDLDTEDEPDLDAEDEPGNTGDNGNSLS
jgi:hypothetical protein